jgi:hypothetical protein
VADDKLSRREKLIELRGQEAGLFQAIALLDALAAPMIERLEADPAGPANRQRRPRIKAYQVAATRLRTRLRKVRRLAERLEAPEDVADGEEAVKNALRDLGL